MSLKIFTFFVRNDRTREIATFCGQGKTIDEAMKDAITTITTVINPSQSGVQNKLTNYLPDLIVQLPNGNRVERSKKDFEGDEAYKS